MADGRPALGLLISTEDAEILVCRSLAGAVSSGINLETGTVPVAKAAVVKLIDGLDIEAVDRMMEGEEAVASFIGTEVALADDREVGAVAKAPDGEEAVRSSAGVVVFAETRTAGNDPVEKTLEDEAVKS